MQEACCAASTANAREAVKSVQVYTCNPKCVSMGELYGELFALTGEWKEGLAACLFKEAASDTSDSHKWVVFDGPVDAIWVENLNSVGLQKCVPACYCILALQDCWSMSWL